MGEPAVTSSNTQVPIFVDTNLGTHIALSVPPQILARDFKKQLEIAHLKCFPEAKAIEVYELMVKKKSCFYRLPDWIPIKLAFKGVRGTWFLHVEARTRSEPYLLTSLTESICRISNEIGATDHLGGDIHVSNVDKSDTHQQASRSIIEVQSPRFSEVKSVTSIIKQYFLNSHEDGFTSPASSEVTSKRKKARTVCCSSIQVQVPKIILFPSPSECGEKIVKGTINGADVGERLVTATNNHGLFSSKKKYAKVCTESSFAMQSVFEISDSDE